MDLTLRPARLQDTAAAQALYRGILDHLAETVDFPHWHSENHPTPDEVAASIAAGELHLAVSDGALVGAVILNHDAAAGYADAAWAVDAAPEEVLVVHLLGVAPEFLGQGAARFLVEASLRIARDRACRTVRLDTYVENTPARNLYTRCGFTDLGVHTIRYEGTDLSEFHLFEHVL